MCKTWTMRLPAQLSAFFMSWYCCCHGASMTTASPLNVDHACWITYPAARTTTTVQRTDNINLRLSAGQQWFATSTVTERPSRGESTSSRQMQAVQYGRGAAVRGGIALAMSQSDPAEQRDDDHDHVGGVNQAPFAPLNRSQLISGGWLALLGLAFVGGKQGQDSYHDRKRALFESIGGDDVEFRNILEVGVGGDPKLGGFRNLEYYRRGQHVVGVDPALYGKSLDLEMAATKARKKGVTFTGMGGVAEKLPFETGSFDAVVSTLVFCSVRDPVAALQEVSRVLRPGGKFVFVEHIHAPEEGLSILGLRQQQDLLDPLQQALAGGCHLTRETDRLIREAAGGPSSSRLFSRLESMDSVRVGSMWPVSEQVFGVAVK